MEAALRINPKDEEVRLRRLEMHYRPESAGNLWIRTIFEDADGTVRKIHISRGWKGEGQTFEGTDLPWSGQAEGGDWMTVHVVNTRGKRGPDVLAGERPVESMTDAELEAELEQLEAAKRERDLSLGKLPVSEMTDEEVLAEIQLLEGVKTDE
jgi:hypothetical protein